jgi:hypothetical protein
MDPTRIFQNLVDIILVNSRAKRGTIHDYWAKRFSITLQKGVADHIYKAFRSLIDKASNSKSSYSLSNSATSNDHPIDYLHWIQFSQL